MSSQPLISSLLSFNRYYEKYAAPLSLLGDAWKAISKHPLYRKTLQRDIIPGVANMAGFTAAGALSDKLINDKPLPSISEFAGDVASTAPLYFGVGALMRGTGNISDKVKRLINPNPALKRPPSFMKSILYPKPEKFRVPPLSESGAGISEYTNNAVRGAGWGALAGALSDTDNPISGAAKGALAFGVAHPLIWGPQWHGLEKHFNPNTSKGQFLSALRYQPEFSLFQLMQKNTEKKQLANEQAKQQEYLRQLREQNPQYFEQLRREYPQYFNN